MRTLVVILIGSLTACSLSARERCQQWQQESEITSSIEHCVECSKTLGKDDVRAIRRCMLERDKAVILGR